MNINQQNSGYVKKRKKLVPTVLMAIWAAAVLYGIMCAFGGFNYRVLFQSNCEFGVRGFLYGFAYATFYARIAMLAFMLVCIAAKARLNRKRAEQRYFQPNVNVQTRTFTARKPSFGCDGWSIMPNADKGNWFGRTKIS